MKKRETHSHPIHQQDESENTVVKNSKGENRIVWKGVQTKSTLSLQKKSKTMMMLIIIGVHKLIFLVGTPIVSS